MVLVRDLSFNCFVDIDRHEISSLLFCLGDPDDKSLRKVELEVSIPGIVRERAHREKCHDFIDGIIIESI